MAHILMSQGLLGDSKVVSKLKPMIKSNMKVCFLALSYFKDQFKDQKSYLEFYSEGGEYYDKIVNQFSLYGINKKQISWILDSIDNHESATKKIKEADILYFPGGAPDLFMDRIRTLGLTEIIEAHSGHFIGSSAGTMIQFKNYYISKDSDYHRFTYEEGLNLLTGFFVETHYRRKVQQKKAMRKVYRANHEPIFGLPDDGLIIVNKDEIELIYPASIIYGNKGIYDRK
ncbi:MAG: Type 1 glutamine amidotransferase-like domain-containing protein [Acholeplasmataceae bacterium]|nr:Type 1 glutamine amidotransferase-like domain-containing protein [Acholeplasmataceae bacterium]